MKTACYTIRGTFDDRHVAILDIEADSEDEALELAGDQGMMSPTVVAVDTGPTGAEGDSLDAVA